MNTTSAGEDALVIGSGFCCDLRSFRHHSECVCFVASILSNVVLAVMLVREKNEVMRPYSRVLLINVGFDCFYTVVCMVLEMVRLAGFRKFASKKA